MRFDSPGVTADAWSHRTPGSIHVDFNGVRLTVIVTAVACDFSVMSGGGHCFPTHGGNILWHECDAPEVCIHPFRLMVYTGGGNDIRVPAPVVPMRSQFYRSSNEPPGPT